MQLWWAADWSISTPDLSTVTVGVCVYVCLCVVTVVTIQAYVKWSGLDLLMGAKQCPPRADVPQGNVLSTFLLFQTVTRHPVLAPLQAERPLRWTNHLILHPMGVIVIMRRRHLHFHFLQRPKKLKIVPKCGCLGVIIQENKTNLFKSKILFEYLLIFQCYDI